MNTVGPLESQHREVEELFLRLARATDSETTTRLLAVVIRQPFHCVRHWKCVCSGGPVLPAYGVFSRCVRQGCPDLPSWERHCSEGMTILSPSEGGTKGRVCRMVLHEFLVSNRGAILDRSRANLAMREIPTPTESELVDGLPLFLDQLTAVLGAEKDARGPGHRSISASAALHGGELSRMGLTVGQVVQDYGSICQSVTELAGERKLAITADEFHTFNRCLDDATAQAVTEYEHQRDRAIGGPGVEQLGFLAHEMRNLLTTSMLTFDALSRGTVGVHGSTSALLGRSLRRMRALIDRTLAEVRLGAGAARPERVSVAELIEEIEIIATIEANDRDIQLSIDPGARDVAVQGDPQILASVIANLVQNAFKFTRPRGHITVRTHATSERVLIEVQDECGGLPPGMAEDLFRPFEQHGVDQTGLGLGLSISMKGVRASGGELHVRNLPGSGCTFTVDLPRAPVAS